MAQYSIGPCECCGEPIDCDNCWSTAPTSVTLSIKTWPLWTTSPPINVHTCPGVVGDYVIPVAYSAPHTYSGGYDVSMGSFSYGGSTRDFYLRLSAEMKCLTSPLGWYALASASIISTPSGGGLETTACGSSWYYDPRTVWWSSQSRYVSACPITLPLSADAQANADSKYSGGVFGYPWVCMLHNITPAQATVAIT